MNDDFYKVIYVLNFRDVSTLPKVKKYKFTITFEFMF